MDQKEISKIVFMPNFFEIYHMFRLMSYSKYKFTKYCRTRKAVPGQFQRSGGHRKCNYLQDRFSQFSGMANGPNFSCDLGFFCMVTGSTRMTCPSM